MPLKSHCPPTAEREFTPSLHQALMSLAICAGWESFLS